MKDEEQTYENFQSINDLINMKSEDNTPKKRKRLIKNAQKKVKEEEIDHNDIEEESHDNILDDEAEGLIDNEEENYSNSLHSISESEPEEEEERPAKLTKKKRKRGKEKKSKKGKKKFMSDLLLREADEDEDDEEEEDGDGEITNWERDKLMKEMMGPKLKPRSENIYDQSEEELIKRYNNMGELMEIENETMAKSNYAIQPSISDPKLWLVKCRIGKERESVESILHKYFHVNSKSTDKIKILSACSFDALKGYIYIEAFKEANVREAIQGISSLKENSIKIVPITEMTQVFQFDKVQTVSLKPKDWVRMKSGLYENDIAQVIQVIDPISKILVKLLPRISDTVSNNRAGKVIRPIPKLFNPTHFDKVEQRNHPYLGPCLQWNKQTFKDGFLIKQVSIRSLLTQNIVPSIEELKIFSLSSDEHTDLNTLVETLQETGLKKKKFVKGDKVKLVKGGLNGITGKIVSYSGNTVQVQVEVEGIDDILEFPEDYVIKDFLPGDMVRVVTGPNIGKHGLLVNIDGDTAVIYSDDGEFKASSQDLVSATEVTTESNVSNPYFNHGDLIKINNVSNSVCYVLEVHKYSLKVIDTRSEVKNVPIRDAAKWTNLKPNGIDAKRNPITKQDTVKIIAGPNKSRKGVIKNIFRNFVFLFNQDFVNSNGIFVEKSENVEIMGSELLVDGIDVTKGKVNLKKIPDEIKSLLGKTIKIIKGNWKGYFGTLRNVTDKNAYVELLSKNKTITIDLSAIQSIDDDPSARRSDFMATPRSSNVPKTPAYYPQSPSFAKSPSWNVTATPNYYQAMSPNPNSFLSPGNKYR